MHSAPLHPLQKAAINPPSLINLQLKKLKGRAISKCPENDINHVAHFFQEGTLIFGTMQMTLQCLDLSMRFGMFEKLAFLLNRGRSSCTSFFETQTANFSLGQAKQISAALVQNFDSKNVGMAAGNPCVSWT